MVDQKQLLATYAVILLMIQMDYVIKENMGELHNYDFIYLISFIITMFVMAFYKRTNRWAFAMLLMMIILRSVERIEIPPLKRYIQISIVFFTQYSAYYILFLEKVNNG